MTAGKITTYQVGASHFYHAPLSGDGYIALNASAAVIATARNNKGRVTAGTTHVDGATVTKTGTGEYTVTLNGKFPRLRSVTANMTFNATPVDLVVSVVGPTVNLDTAADTQVFKLVTCAGATPTNASAACGIFLHFTLENR